MFASALNLIVGLFAFSSVPVQAGRRLSPCEKALLSFTVEEILGEAKALEDEIEIPKLLVDNVNPSMRVFEPIHIRQADRGHKLEVQSARDYASFVSARSQTFVFAGQFSDTSIPVFDGLVLDHDGKPLYNVSLKFASVKMPVMKEETLLQSLASRLQFRHEMRLTANTLNWLTAMNNWQVPTNRPYLLKSFDRDMRRGMIAAKIFGIGDQKTNVFGRPKHLVLDMRASGYSYHFVSQPELQRRIQDVVYSSGYEDVTLTLLWNSEQVLEFNPS